MDRHGVKLLVTSIYFRPIHVANCSSCLRQQIEGVQLLVFVQLLFSSTAPPPSLSDEQEHLGVGEAEAGIYWIKWGSFRIGGLGSVWSIN